LGWVINRKRTGLGDRIQGVCRAVVVGIFHADWA